jgi:hypothetical protein
MKPVNIGDTSDKTLMVFHEFIIIDLAFFITILPLCTGSLRRNTFVPLSQQIMPSIILSADNSGDSCEYDEPMVYLKVLDYSKMYLVCLLFLIEFIACRTFYILQFVFSKFRLVLNETQKVLSVKS